MIHSLAARLLGSLRRPMPAPLRVVSLVGSLLFVAARRRAQAGEPKGREQHRQFATCVPIPAELYRRPDPLIYSQSYLMGRGLAVTWDNPDIHLMLDGTPVDSSLLKPDTEYQVIARVWNGSPDAPAVNLPVRFSYLSFGIGATLAPIGETVVDLPVNGAAGLPALAIVPWRTPAIEGHYCLRVELIWPDDANPDNNLGQENTYVKALNSPRAELVFPVRNDNPRARVLRLEADAYRIPPLPTCDPNALSAAASMTRQEFDERRRLTQMLHDRQAFPVPEGWIVAISPNSLRLAPGEQQQVSINVTAPDDFHGRQVLNINAWEDRTLVGGITLYVTGSAT
jgi:hypothetical protein